MAEKGVFRDADELLEPLWKLLHHHRGRRQPRMPYENALALINAAKVGGADAVKFQTYKAPLIAMKDSPAYWDTAEEDTLTQLEIFSRYDAFEPSDYQALAAHCDQVGISCRLHSILRRAHAGAPCQNL